MGIAQHLGQHLVRVIPGQGGRSVEADPVQNLHRNPLCSSPFKPDTVERARG